MLKLKNVKFAYTAGGRRYSVTTQTSRENKRVRLEIDTCGDVFTASLKTISPIVIERLTAEFEYFYEPDCRIFLNGYQSWTDSIEHTVNERMRGIDHIPAAVVNKFAFSQYGDYSFVKYSHRRGVFHGFSYGYVRKTTGEYDLIGSLNENEAFTVIRTDVEKGVVTVEKDCKGVEIEGFFRGIMLYIGSGSENAVFDRYFELMEIDKPKAKPIFGYTSWYRHYQDISEKVIGEDLAGLKNADHKADVFQIDDGYQTAVGDWLSIDSVKFPNGMQAVAEAISNEGFTPGIWLAPFACEENSEIFKTKKDWLLKDSTGEPVKAGSNWSGFYALDIYNKDFREYLKEVFDTIVNKWGYKLLKLDFLYAACLLPREDKPRGRVMSDGMDLLRELAGDAMILGCGVPMASAFGKVEYCRIGCDVSLEWDNKPYMRVLHRERTSTKNCILNTVFRRQLNGRAFLNDPDVFLLRDDNTTMTEDEKKCLAELNSRAGSVLFTSDNFDEYDESKREMLDAMLQWQNSGDAHDSLISAELNDGRLTVVFKGNGGLITRNYRAEF